jgi:hypothetical protein
VFQKYDYDGHTYYLELTIQSESTTELNIDSSSMFGRLGGFG